MSTLSMVYNLLLSCWCRQTNIFARSFRVQTLMLLFFPEILGSTIIDHTIIAGLFFACFKELKPGKTQHRKKQRKANCSKNSKYRSHLNISAKKLCYYKGPILTDFQAKIRFFRLLLLSAGKSNYQKTIVALLGLVATALVASKQQQ